MDGGFSCPTEPIETKEKFKILDSQLKPQLENQKVFMNILKEFLTCYNHNRTNGAIICLKFILWEAELQHS